VIDSWSVKSRETNPPREAAAASDEGEPAAAPQEAKKTSIRAEEAADAPANGDDDDERLFLCVHSFVAEMPTADAMRAAKARDAEGHPRADPTASPAATDPDAAASDSAALAAVIVVVVVVVVVVVLVTVVFFILLPLPLSFDEAHSSPSRETRKAVKAPK
jgi:hypothetical protein